MALTPEMKAEIDSMSQYEMARHWRFDKVGQSRYFGEDAEVGQYFKDTFFAKGGMTPEISKALGWGY